MAPNLLRLRRGADGEDGDDDALAQPTEEPNRPSFDDDVVAGTGTVELSGTTAAASDVDEGEPSSFGKFENDVVKAMEKLPSKDVWI